MNASRRIARLAVWTRHMIWTRTNVHKVGQRQRFHGERQDQCWMQPSAKFAIAGIIRQNLAAAAASEPFENFTLSALCWWPGTANVWIESGSSMGRGGWRRNAQLFVRLQRAGHGIFSIDPIAQINEAAAIRAEWKAGMAGIRGWFATRRTLEDIAVGSHGAWSAFTF